jgi:gamma-glutamyltranspeptidase / glutathione hydrolase
MKAMSFSFASRRSMVVGRRGMVASSNPLASAAGLEMLREGGTAADAAVAAAAVLNVTEPASTGIGGDCFALYYDAQSRQVAALNGSGRAPMALSSEMLRGMGYGEMPERSPHAVTVPGAAAGWADLLTRYGAMPLKHVLAPAIAYARDGFPVHPVFGEAWGRSQSFLLASPHTQDFLPGGLTPHVGQIVQLPGLARTLEQVAEGGAAAFYEGEIADAIVSTLEALGGAMTHADLKAHRSTWVEPISTQYRGVTVYECPPNGQGLAALLALNVVGGFDLGSLPSDSPERLHLMIEAMRLAFADTRAYIADPDMATVPTAALLRSAYARNRRALIRYDQALPLVSEGVPGGSDTVYLCAVDAAGNACSFINSLYMGWGSGIVARGTGVFLQNRGAGFTLQAGHPNELAGGKRPYHTIIPAMALRGDDLWAAFGVMGGFMQPQGHLQVLSAMLDDDLNPQEALNQPRWCLVDGTPQSVLALEEGLPMATMARLAELGHRVRPVSGAGRAVFGDGHIIRRDAETGVLYGGSDPRKDGQVAVF